jgi:hypothetical protein
MKVISPRALSLAALLFASSAPAFASDASDVAREAKLPVPAVEAVFANVDAFFAGPQAPANRMMSGVVKEQVLKALRHRVANLEDAVPGKASDSAFEDRVASYKAQIRTTRHETTEAADCVDNKVTVTASEGVPAVKDGAFIFDTTHPRVTSASWDITFCRAPQPAGGWGEWGLSTTPR